MRCGSPPPSRAGANLAVLVLCRFTGDLYSYLSERLGGLTGVQSAETTLALGRVTYAP
ncbi:hypothetical protein ACGFI3_12505 [Nonomuraea wenchangensis]|uniref:hypothetical protein n=1 Tax=Nonomuraea wenchangensis TaxID=568860 RepID=UPI003712DD5D